MIKIPLLGDWIDLVYPPTCPHCGELLPNPSICCSPCLAQIYTTDFHRRPMFNTASFRLGAAQHQGAVSLYYYDSISPLRAYVFALKYRGMSHWARFFGQYYGAILANSAFIQGVDEIITIPLHPSRIRQRGYNQSEYFAQGLAAVLKIPVNTKALRRIKRTKQQALISDKKERQTNLANAFQLIGPIAPSVLLVDDILTTGSTILSACEALSAANTVQEIRIATIGITI
jgi:ComF family protein